MENQIDKLINNYLTTEEYCSEYSIRIAENNCGKDEIKAVIKTLLSNKLTMGKTVEKFEKIFAEYVDSKYAVMVNSGSSALTLAMNVLHATLTLFLQVPPKISGLKWDQK